LQRRERTDAMYSRILVPISGSPCGDRALEEAAGIALSLGAEITVFCVADVFSTVRDGMVEARAVVDAMRSHARRIVSRGEEVVRRAGAVAHGETAEGTPAGEIVRRARDHDLVVMAGRGKRLLERLVAGSVVHAVLARVDRPVLVVTCGAHRHRTAAE